MLPQFANRPATVKFAEMSIELDFQNMLMWLVKQYFKLFASRRALRCSRNSCRPRCKGQDGQKRMDCYAYEMIYDRAGAIGCAVQLHKQSGPTLRAELSCVTDKEMTDGEPVYKVGVPCGECASGNCDQNLKLCAATQQPLIEGKGTVAAAVPGAMVGMGTTAIGNQVIGAPGSLPTAVQPAA